jgi:hypothetical protein
VVKQAVAGVVGLGLIGGVGAVTHGDDGSTKVTITDDKGHQQTVEIAGGNGKTFSCPSGVDAKLEPIDIEAGRIKITMQNNRKELDALDTRIDAAKKVIDGLDKRYPTGEAPHKVVVRYNRLVKNANRLVKRDKALVKRDDQLVDAYNAAIDRHNAVLDAECDPKK